MKNGWVVRVGEGDFLIENFDSDKKALMPLAKQYWPLD
tara:strand:+ start:5972 stop:6085 length:114 start_codon:yes stop_codon:yes gene_type:complete